MPINQPHKQITYLNINFYGQVVQAVLVKCMSYGVATPTIRCHIPAQSNFLWKKNWEPYNAHHMFNESQNYIFHRRYKFNIRGYKHSRNQSNKSCNCFIYSYRKRSINPLTIKYPYEKKLCLLHL